MAEPTEEQKIKFLELLSSGEGFCSSAEQVGCFDKDFYRLCLKDQQFDAEVTRAREKQQDALIDRTEVLARNCDESNVNSTKLKIWAAQWVAGKRAARKYGEKLDLKTEGTVKHEIGDSVTALLERIRAGNGNTGGKAIADGK